MLAKTAGEDLRRHTLANIPNVYGQLVYLGSLRDSSTGVYRHYGLLMAFGREETAAALRESHEEVFREWLNLSLSTRYKDIRKHLASLDGPFEETVRFWIRSRIYLTYIPEGVSSAEKAHFQADFEALLVGLSGGRGA